jgi:hypothetical protein
MNESFFQPRSAIILENQPNRPSARPIKRDYPCAQRPRVSTVVIDGPPAMQHNEELTVKDHEELLVGGSLVKFH